MTLVTHTDPRTHVTTLHDAATGERVENVTYLSWLWDAEAQVLREVVVHLAPVEAVQDTLSGAAAVRPAG